MTIKLFNYQIPKRQIMLAVVDVVIIYGSILLSAVVRLGAIDGWNYIRGNPVSFILIGIVFIFTFFFAELYDTRKDYRAIGNLMTIAFAASIALIITSFLFYVNWSLRVGRGVFVLNGILITIFIIGWRVFYSYLMEQPMFKRNVLIIGAGWAGKTIVREINKSEKSGYNVIGFCDDDPEKKGKVIDGVAVIGNHDTLRDIIRKNEIDFIISAITHEKHAGLIKELINCSWNGVDVVDMPTVYEQLTGKVPFKHINDMWMLHVVISRPKMYGKLIKPVIEVFIALVLFLAFLPVTIVISFFVKWSSKGSVFYTQERAGKDAKTFTIMKFRTMIENAESDTGAVCTSDDDQRITKVGKFLRKWRLDEIPQLINVIKGDMSLIGPRPERYIFIKEFERRIPFYSQRLVVRPGLTGWAQVKYIYTSTIEQTEEKLQYDLYYIKNMSFLLDVVILLKTIKEVLFGRGK